MYKPLLIIAPLVLFLIGCNDKSVLEPTALNENPRASDGISPTDYIEMYHLQLRDASHMPDDFTPLDTIFAADYLTTDEQSQGRNVTIKSIDTEGDTSVVSYSFSDLCGDYLIIYGPTSIGAIRTYEGCPDGIPGDYAEFLGRDSTLNSYLDSILTY